MDADDVGVADARPVVRWTLAQQTRSLAAWAVAIGAVSLMYIGFWPSMKGIDTTSMIDNLPDAMVEAMGYDQISTASGYLSSTVYGLLAPALLMVFATIKGGALLAGAEESSDLELELSAPVGRSQIYLGRLAALWLLVASMSAVVGVVTVVMRTPLDMDVAIGNIGAAVVGLFLLGAMVATVAYAAGAVTGRRAIAAGAGALVGVGSFMLDAIGGGIGADWMTTVSPFSWYIGGEPLSQGFDSGGLARLAAVAVVALVVGLRGFERRDLMV
ncbi:ABC transporter permease subunit [Actinospongicola halichondriae]|uniref:ABC transporter permease subunit n=1 Tax=Actinospongicola halichondriae TaxID=3236844 RepID=UPI003D491041